MYNAVTTVGRMPELVPPSTMHLSKGTKLNIFYIKCKGILNKLTAVRICKYERRFFITSYPMLKGKNYSNWICLATS